MLAQRRVASAFGPGRGFVPECGASVLPYAQHRLGWGFAEQRPIIVREVAEMPEAMVESDRLHERRLWPNSFHGSAHHHQAEALQVRGWAHAANHDEGLMELA